MNNTPYFHFGGTANEAFVIKHFERRSNVSVSLSIGIKNSIVVLTDKDYNIKYLYRSSNHGFDEQKGLNGTVWDMFPVRYFRKIVGYDSEYNNTETFRSHELFVDWLRSFYPEDLNFFLFHPEVFSGKWNPEY